MSTEATAELRASIYACAPFYEASSSPMFVIPYIATASALGMVAVLTVVFIERTIYKGIRERSRELTTYHEEQRRMLLDLAHNLQTPLTVLKTKLEQLERTMIHDGGLTGLRSSVDSIAHFINELLSFAYLEDSLRREPMETFSLSALVAELSEEAATLIESRGITYHWEAEPDLRLYGNEKRIREAVMNLLCNSVKYMGDDPIRNIRLSLQLAYGQACLEITDTGMGIPEAELPHIFERFYRGSARMYGEVPGSGLGLAIVERIVKEHNGVITVTSEIDKGSTFTLHFPFAEQGRS